VRRLCHIGNYGTTGMGVPLLILGSIGAVALGRRSPTLLTMLLGQLALAVAASAARLYPLDDRLVFFAVPTLWLLAAVGIDATILFCCSDFQSFYGLVGRSISLNRVAVCVLVLPLIPGVIRYCYWTAVVPQKAEFRQAFEFVQGRAERDDLLWVSQA